VNPPANATLTERSKKLCCVLASDAGFFRQAVAAINTLNRFRNHAGVDVHFISIGLKREQLQWLERQQIAIYSRTQDFPRFNGAPDHAVALTCRPFLPEAIGGYAAYMWIDSDVRFLRPEGLAFYAQNALASECSIAIADELEPAYGINHDPSIAAIYHRQKNERIRDAFGDETMRYLEFAHMYNAGLFAAADGSPLWARYQRNLEKTLGLPYNSMREQDAMLVSIVEVQGARIGSSNFNWLCSLSLPIRATGGDGWCSRLDPERKIAVVHLTNSTSPLMVNGERATYYDYYRMIGLTE
jgi:hypothetical protein